MLGLKKRKRVEGWALEISNNGSAVEHIGTAQRLIESNKVWIACLIAVVMLTLVFVKTSNRGGPADAKLGPAPAGFYVHNNQDRYRQFENTLMSNGRLGRELLSARFLSPGRLRLVVGGTVSADDIEYLAKMAAEQVKHDFAHRVVVMVYMQSGKEKTERLVATATWQEKTYGFVVKRHDDSSGML